MEKNAKYFVATLLGGFIAYFIASRLDLDSFAMKMFAMVILTAAFSTLVLRLMGRGESQRADSADTGREAGG